MSFGDEHGYGNEPDHTGHGYGGAGQTRTRLPEGNGGDGYGGTRRTGRSSRSLIMVVGVVVLLVAAIAFANRGGGSVKASGSRGGAPGANPTAASGVKPVTGKNGSIPSGFAHNAQGAASAATNYAVALGSDGMFNRASRDTLLAAVYTPEAAGKLGSAMDSAYSAAFLQKLGLNANGNPPQGNTFISRTIPIGTKVESLAGDLAKVSVWYTGLIGMAGPKATNPVTTTWKTWTFELQWTANDWKVVSDTQKDGPAPIPGDFAASTSDAISKAVEQFGGFTYAR